MLRDLMGSGDRIMLAALPFLAIGLLLNFLLPQLFSVGGPPAPLKVISSVILVAGVTTWIWSVALILIKVPKHELITSGPYTLVKHPLYTGVALFVLPWLGFLLDSWLGIALGLVIYLASRIFSPEEERRLSVAFGAKWEEYAQGVKFPWL
jgi:protein-S-isoprenylcysteine O-methyltransferase Ste14